MRKWMKMNKIRFKEEILEEKGKRWRYEGLKRKCMKEKCGNVKRMRQEGSERKYIRKGSWKKEQKGDGKM